MEIRKADSKGRVTGFEPGELYAVDKEGGTFSVVVLKAPDGRPLTQALTEEMVEFHKQFAKIAFKVR